MLDVFVLAIATVLAAVGTGWLIVDDLRAARAGEGERRNADLTWTLLWAMSLECALRGRLGVTMTVQDPDDLG